MKVFISSTYVDLIEYRKKAIDVALRHKCLPLAMEFFNAQTEDGTTVCDKEIRECDIFIGIYAHRYGYIKFIKMAIIGPSVSFVRSFRP